jgi:hypothetical protein
LFYLRFLENMRFASTGARFLRFLLESCFGNSMCCAQTAAPEVKHQKRR